MDVPERAVQRALQPLDVGGVVLADGDAPLRPAGPRALHVEVGGVEHDAASARRRVRLVEEAPVEGPDAVGVVALEARGVAGGVVGDGPGRDERHARDADGNVGDVGERQDPRRGHQPQAARGRGAGQLVDDAQQHRRVVVARDDHGGRDLREPSERADAELQRLVGRARRVEEVAGVQDQVGPFGLGNLQQPAQGLHVVRGAVVPAELRAEMPVRSMEQLHGSTSVTIGRGTAGRPIEAIPPGSFTASTSWGVPPRGAMGRGAAGQAPIGGRLAPAWQGAPSSRPAGTPRRSGRPHLSVRRAAGGVAAPGRVTGPPPPRSGRPSCSGCGPPWPGPPPRRPPPRRGWWRTGGTGSGRGWARARWAARRPWCRA